MINRKTLENVYLRLLVCIGLPIFFIVSACVFFIMKKTPPCYFYKLTGIYCPGCGSGRAMLSLMSGDLLRAFDHNPLLVIFLPIAVYFLLKVYIAFLIKKDVLPLPKIKSSAFGISVFAAVILFWILRNIPLFPFTFLAP